MFTGSELGMFLWYPVWTSSLLRLSPPSESGFERSDELKSIELSSSSMIPIRLFVSLGDTIASSSSVSGNADLSTNLHDILKKLTNFSSSILERYWQRLLMLYFDMFEFAIQIVKLQHQKSWFIVFNIVFRSQVDRYINLILYLNHKTEIWHTFGFALRKFKEIDWVWSYLFIFYVQIKDVKHRYTCSKRIVKVLHPLVLCLRYLLIRVKELNNWGDPG